MVYKATEAAIGKRSFIMSALNLHVFLVLLTLMARLLAQDALVVFAPLDADKVGVYDVAT
ncbi:MAG: hypothetical protein GY822_21670, partial [Deltaproteobacteria bacterium]|nr:hypothetical protein [Deltaproteobacteria bacterium]